MIALVLSVLFFCDGDARNLKSSLFLASLQGGVFVATCILLSFGFEHLKYTTLLLGIYTLVFSGRQLIAGAIKWETYKESFFEMFLHSFAVGFILAFIEKLGSH